MTLPVSDIVAVSVSVAPKLPTVPVNLGSLVVFGSSTRLPFGARLSYYPDLTSVGNDFNTTDREYLAAKKWFSQSPAPQLIGIARRFTAATNGELLGVPVTTLLSALAAINNGTLHLVIDGVAHDITGIDLTSAVSLAGVATLLETDIQVSFAGATVVYHNGQFILRSGTTGAASTVAAATTPGSGTYLGTLLGWDTALKPISTPGVVAESLTDSLNAVRTLDNSWYAAFVTDEVEDNTDVQALAAWQEANFGLSWYTTADGNCLVAASSADIGSLLKAAGFSRTIGQFDNQTGNDNLYDILSAAACLLTTDFNQPNSAKILKFKQEPGVPPLPTLTEVQRRTLESKNMNYYATFGNFNMFSPGVVASGRFVDEVFGLDALNLEIQNNVFAYLAGRQSKVAQTDRDVTGILQQIGLACDKFVRAGFLAPGYWNGAAVGSIKSGDFLKAGYYAYAAPVASQSPTDRGNRLAPPITVIACGAGAVQQITINLNFQR